MLQSLTTNAAGLTALAAILAVVIGPWIQSHGATKQGRSQAFGQFITQSISEIVNEIARMVELAIQVRAYGTQISEEAKEKLYLSHLRATLLVGKHTDPGLSLCSKISILRDVVLDSNVNSGSIEMAVDNVSKAFDAFVASERARIRSGG